MSPSPVHGADASLPSPFRSRSGILTPTSAANLNANDGPAVSVESRKRKRADSVAMEHLLNAPVTLQTCPLNIHLKPRNLHPLMLLPRHQLSFASIDLADPQGDLPQSRFFESHIKIMDLETRMGSSENLLIARHDRKGTLFALDRQANGLYVVFKLGSWVDFDSLVKHATVLCRERIDRQSLKAEISHRDVPSTSISAHTYKDEKNKMDAIAAIQSLVKKRARSQSVAAFDDTTKSEPTSDIVVPPLRLPSLQPSTHQSSDPVKKQSAAPGTHAKGEHSAENTADGIFANIRTHYSEALYKSRGSLAYFAKGPLSRARSTFHLDLESNLDTTELIDFLKSLILTTVQIDKKYREKVPELISKMGAVVVSSDDGKKKQRRPKKMKLNKDGLYPLEDESIRHWWIDNRPGELNDDGSGISMQQIKSRASLLRTRETQLQMILIMEILALEPLKAPEQATDSLLPTLPGAPELRADMASPPQLPRKRNKYNLPVLIDVHADRLTIWQSTASDEQLLLEDSQTPSQPKQTRLDQKASSEPLKDFCVDIILPFYASRLPQLCDSLNRKLGGPVAVPTPKLRSSLKKYFSKNEQKPGAAARRPALRKEARTLERALSFEQESRRSMSRGPTNVLALMRSATSAAIPTIKREGSDSALFSTAAKAESNSMSVKQRSTSLARSVSMVDLRDTKATKKAKVEEELKDAISALRKPNRNVVGQAMAEAAERKTSTLLSAKKVRKPVPRPSIKANVLVQATPTTQRFKNIFGVKPESAADVALPSTEEMIPPSSIGVPLLSTVRRNTYWHIDTASPALKGVECTPTKISKTSNLFARPAIKETVGCTPSKSSRSSNALARPSAEEAMILPSSPLKSHIVTSPQSPRVPGRAIKPLRKLNLGRRPDANVLLETPVKKSATLLEGGDGLSKIGKENSASIYSKLGWDDDLDDLL